MGIYTRFSNLLFGRPQGTTAEHGECIGPLAGIPVFGLDALSLAAYGPEAALTPLIPLGLMGLHCARSKDDLPSSSARPFAQVSVQE
jgi:hypothetical protein